MVLRANKNAGLNSLSYTEPKLRLLKCNDFFYNPILHRLHIIYMYEAIKISDFSEMRALINAPVRGSLLMQNIF